MIYMDFKSGTDIRGFAADGFENEKLFMSDGFIEKTVLAFVEFMCEKKKKSGSDLKISVGHDSRVSAERIKRAVIRALTSQGVTVCDCSLSSTPAMFMSIVELGLDAAVQITASHHPWERNGLKFFTENGGLEGDDIKVILKKAQGIEKEIRENPELVTKIDFMAQYSSILREQIRKGVNAENYAQPLAGYKIIVDAGNGAGGFYAENVLKPLGADIEGSQFLEPDGMFPNHIPNPENETAMKSICAATVASGADLGIIFDTDVDRAGCVDSGGNEINRNMLVALAAKIALEGSDGGYIVTDSVTSDGLREFINSIGGKHYRYKRGYKNVINKQIELNNAGKFCPLAIETSGHAAFKENYYLDDGAYLVTKIIIFMAKHGGPAAITEVISSLKKPAEEKELRFKITQPDFADYGNRVLKDLEAFAASKDGWLLADDNRDGIRVSLDKDHGAGWFLLRLSVHDPVMPFNCESETEGGCEKIIAEFSDFILNYPSLDTGVLKK